MRKSRYANCIFIGIVAKRQVGMYSIRDSDGIVVLKMFTVTYLGTVPSSCYPAPSLEPIFGQYLGSGGSTDDQMMCVNEGWCPAFE